MIEKWIQITKSIQTLAEYLTILRQKIARMLLKIIQSIQRLRNSLIQPWQDRSRAPNIGWAHFK